MQESLHRFKATFFKTLGHPTRLAIVDFLREGEKSVNELQTLLGADQSTVSQQLAKLRNARIVRPRKKGTTVFYSVADPLVFKLLDVGQVIFSQATDDAPDTRQPVPSDFAAR